MRETNNRLTRTADRMAKSVPTGPVEACAWRAVGWVLAPVIWALHLVEDAVTVVVDAGWRMRQRAYVRRMDRLVNEDRRRWESRPPSENDDKKMSQDPCTHISRYDAVAHRQILRNSDPTNRNEHDLLSAMSVDDVRDVWDRMLRDKRLVEQLFSYHDDELADLWRSCANEMLWERATSAPKEATKGGAE